MHGLKSGTKRMSHSSREKLSRLLEEMEQLPVAHRYQALQEMMSQLEPAERLDLLHDMFQARHAPQAWPGPVRLHAQSRFGTASVLWPQPCAVAATVPFS